MKLSLQPVEDAPSDWIRIPLQALGNQHLERNKGLRNDNLLSLSYGLIKNKDIDSNEGLLPESFETYQLVQPGDLIFRFTDLQNDLRSLRSAIVTERGIITSAYLCFRPNPKRVSPQYLNYLMRAYDLAKVFYAFGGGVRQSLKYDEVRNLPIALPPRDEQDAIVHFLDVEISRIDNLITTQNSFRSLLAERDHSTRQRLIEADWPLVRFGRVVRQVLGNGDADTGVSLDAIESWTGHVLIENLQTNVSGTLFRAGDVLFGRLRPYLAKSSAPDFKGAALGDVLVFRSDLVEASFLSLLMRTRSFIEHCTGASYGTKMPRVNWDTIREFEFPLPPREVQIEIVEKVSLELARSEFLRSKSLSLSDLLTNRKTSLIANVVTGKVELQGETDG